MHFLNIFLPKARESKAKGFESDVSSLKKFLSFFFLYTFMHLSPPKVPSRLNNISLHCCRCHLTLNSGMRTAIAFSFQHYQGHVFLLIPSLLYQENVYFLEYIPFFLFYPGSKFSLRFLPEQII